MRHDQCGLGSSRPIIRPAAQEAGRLSTTQAILHRHQPIREGVRMLLWAHLSVAVVVEAVAAEALEQRGRGKPAGPAACPTARIETETEA